MPLGMRLCYAGLEQEPVMESVTLAEAKEQLAELIERAAKGEDVRINNPRGVAVRLVLAEAQPLPRGLVVFGQWKQLAEIPEERLLAPLDDNELAWLSGERDPVE